MSEDRFQVLLADDEDLFRDTTADLLRKAGYACDCACDGAQAAGMLAAKTYDVLISDIKMPGNGNLQLLFETSTAARGLPIILVTGYPTMETALDAIKLPVVAYLIKPVNFDELLSCVRVSVARSSLYRTTAQMRSRLECWSAELGAMEEVLCDRSYENLADPTWTLLTAALDITSRSLTDVRRIIESLPLVDSNKVPVETQRLLERLSLARHALHDAVEGLEESKRAFKSKRLGELRRQLQEVLETLEGGLAAK